MTGNYWLLVLVGVEGSLHVRNTPGAKISGHKIRGEPLEQAESLGGCSQGVRWRCRWPRHRVKKEDGVWCSLLSDGGDGTVGSTSCKRDSVGHSLWDN